MKKLSFKILLSISLSASLFQSCSKSEIIDLDPQFNLVDNPKSLDEVESVLLGAYVGFRGANYYGSGSGTGGGWSMMPDVLGDDMFETTLSLANSRVMSTWTYDVSTGQVASFFQSPYAVVQRSNIVLREAKKYLGPNTVDRVNSALGQSYLVRAWAHFDVFRYFAPFYDRNSTTNLALPYIRETDAEVITPDFKPSRLNNQQFYNRLFADLDSAIKYLGLVDLQPGGRSIPFMDLAAAYGLKARVSLYAQDWQGVVNNATQALSLRPVMDGVADPDGFVGMYQNTNDGEIIWNVQFETNQSGPTFLVYFATNGRSYFRPSPQLAVGAGNSGLIRSNDIRFFSNFTQAGANLNITKYQGKFNFNENSVVSNGNANFIAMRAGEMLVSRAEAYARLGGALNETRAQNDLNELKDKRMLTFTPVTATGQDLITECLNERRRELFAEGHRFFDLKRTTRTISRPSPCGTANSPVSNCTLSPTAREWALPIPEVETRTNSNMIQNEGYN